MEPITMMIIAGMSLFRHLNKKKYTPSSSTTKPSINVSSVQNNIKTATSQSQSFVQNTPVNNSPKNRMCQPELKKANNNKFTK